MGVDSSRQAMRTLCHRPHEPAIAQTFGTLSPGAFIRFRIQTCDDAQMILGIPGHVAYERVSGAQAWAMAALEPTRLKRMS